MPLLKKIIIELYLLFSSSCFLFQMSFYIWMLGLKMIFLNGSLLTKPASSVILEAR